MDKNAYRNELNALRFTQSGKTALTDALMEAPSAPRRAYRPWKGLAAGLAAVLLVGSALAAAGPLWERYFGQLDDSQQAVIDTLSQQLPTVESNGTVMTPLAAFGDQNFYYLMLEIRAPEGVVLPDYGEDEGFYQFFNPDTDERMTVTDGTGQELPCAWEYDRMERSGSGTLIAVIRLWAEDGLDFSDGTDKILHIPGLWVQSPDKEYTPVLTGSWDFNIGAYTGGIESLTPDTTGVTFEDERFGTVTLDALRLSPLGMWYHCSWDHTAENEDILSPGAEITVVMKDGSEAILSNNMGTGNSQEEDLWYESYGPFEAPIDLEQAVAVRWGSALIPLD